MMTVLYGIGTILRFILRVVLLPVQAVLTLMMLAMAFVGSLTCTLFEIIGTLGVICGLYEFISSTGSVTSGWQFLIGGILLVIIPQALTIWGEVGLLNLKDLLARI
ncbi:MAG: hypothetical protein J6U37_03465 [Lachnospiraceae bacterium]|nr:hypothetical protein [Lachnospiraceae bacterium]